MIIETRALLARLGGNSGSALRLLRLFAQQVEKDLAALHEAAAERDLRELGRIAHGLAGAAGVVAAERIRELASSIEARARGGSGDEAAGFLRDLDLAADQLRSELPGLEQELEVPPPSA